MKFPLCWIASSFVLASAGFGQTDQPVRLDPFTVTGSSDSGAAETASGSRYALPIKDIPFPVELLSSETMKDFMVFDFNEIAAFAPSFSPQEGTGKFFLRGLASSSTYVNGIRDLGLFGTAFVDRIELIYGANAAIYGQTIPSGLRNVVTLQPLPHNMFDLRVSGGSDGYDRYSFDGNVTAAGGKVAIRISTFREDSDQRAIRGWNSRQRGAYVAAKWTIDPNTQISFNLENTASHQSPTLTQPVVLDATTKAVLGVLGVQDISGFPRSQYYGFTFLSSQAFNDVNVVRGDLTLSHTFAGGLSARVIVNSGHRSQGDDGLNGTPQIDTATRSTASLTNKTSFLQFYENLQERQNAGQADVLEQFKLGPTDHKLLVTADYLKQKTADVALAQYVPTQNVDAADYTYLGPVWGVPPYLTDQKNTIVDQTIQGVLISERASLFADRLDLMIGGRRDEIKTTQTNRKFAAGDEVDLSHAWQPVATANTLQSGAVVKVIPELSLYGNFSQSFTPGSGTTFDYSGQPLGNQKGQGEEAGVKGSLLGSKLNFTVGVYRIQQGNIAVTATNAAGQALLPASGVGSYSVTATELSEGLEESISYAPTAEWFFSTAYGVNNVHYSEISPLAPTQQILLNRAPAGVPRNNASAMIRYEFKTGWLKGLNARVATLYQGRALISPSISAANGSLFYIPGYTIWDAGVGYAWKAYGLNHRLDFNLKNAFNLEYYRGGPFAGIPRETYISYELQY